jgi:hypothetical protein
MTDVKIRKVIKCVFRSNFISSTYGWKFIWNFLTNSHNIFAVVVFSSSFIIIILADLMHCKSLSFIMLSSLFTFSTRFILRLPLPLILNYANEYHKIEHLSSPTQNIAKKNSIMKYYYMRLNFVFLHFFHHFILCAL